MNNQTKKFHDGVHTGVYRKTFCRSGSESTFADKCRFAQFRLRPLPEDAQCASARNESGYPQASDVLGKRGLSLRQAG